MPSGGGGAGRATGRRARLAAWLAMVAALCGALLAASVLPARAQVPEVEAAFVARIAAERAAAGRGTLSVADDLVAVARRHSATMAAENRLYHNPALGTQVVNWLKVGENVGTGGTVDNIHAALMASPTHRDEILGASFTQVGVGVATSNGALWVTQVFRLPEAAAPAPRPAPAQAPQPPAASPTAVAPVVPATSPRGTAAPPRPEARTAAPRSAPPRPAAATTVPPSTAPPTTAPPATTPPTAPPVTAPAPPPSIDLRPVQVSASTVAPLRSGVVGVGMVAATLLWAVTAGFLRSALLRPARRR